jgi:hypothetical protein
MRLVNCEFFMGIFYHYPDNDSFGLIFQTVILILMNN